MADVDAKRETTQSKAKTATYVRMGNEPGTRYGADPHAKVRGGGSKRTKK